VIVHVRLYGSGGPHEIRWVVRGQIHVWSNVCRENPLGFGATLWCST
jgi:hypothetical protein